MFLDSVHTWHVSKAGNDSNSGHAGQYPVNLAADAKLTIGAAIAAAAAGDTIFVWPGSYTENGLNLSKQLTLIGSGIEATKIISTTSDALRISVSHCTVRGLSAIAPSSGVYDGISIYKIPHTTIEKCYGFGNVSGIHVIEIESGIGGYYTEIINCKGFANGCGIRVDHADRVKLKDCLGHSYGTYGTWRAGIYFYLGVEDIAENIIGICSSEAEDDYIHFVGVYTESITGIFKNILCLAENELTLSPHTEFLGFCNMGASHSPLLINNLLTRVLAYSGIGYGLYNGANGRIIVNGASLSGGLPLQEEGISFLATDIYNADTTFPIVISDYCLMQNSRSGKIYEGSHGLTQWLRQNAPVGAGL